MFDKESLYKFCSKSNGVSLPDIKKQFPNIKEFEIVEILNFLLSDGTILVLKEGDILRYKTVCEDELSIFEILNDDEKVIYQCIKTLSNSGIWSKDLKTKTNLHQAVISKYLKSLENKKLVKTVKSAKNLTRKLYMLYDIEPATEISGGPWFTDFELDNEFVDELASSTLRLVSSELQVSQQTKNIPPISSEFLNCEYISNLISKANICNMDLESEHIYSIISRLNYDSSIYMAVDDDEELSWSYLSINPKDFCLFGYSVGSQFSI